MKKMLPIILIVILLISSFGAAALPEVRTESYQISKKYQM